MNTYIDDRLWNKEGDWAFDDYWFPRAGLIQINGRVASDGVNPEPFNRTVNGTGDHNSTTITSKRAVNLKV